MNVLINHFSKKQGEKGKWGYHFFFLRSNEDLEKIPYAVENLVKQGWQVECCEVLHETKAREKICNLRKDAEYEYLTDNLTYDVVFHSDTSCDSKGFFDSYQKCFDYIKQYNGTNESYFEDYKGGSVCIHCIETEEVVYDEIIY